MNATDIFQRLLRMEARLAMLEDRLDAIRANVVAWLKTAGVVAELLGFYLLVWLAERYFKQKGWE